ncbi:MAG: hypothetical protein RLZZ375_382 [Pseudomonadota bacterium]|jgi:hypothetical protein
MRALCGMIGVMFHLVPAHADTVRSNQKDYGSQSNTVTSHAHGAPAKVVPPPTPASVNPVVVVTPPVAPQPAPAGRRP